VVVVPSHKLGVEHRIGHVLVGLFEWDYHRCQVRVNVAVLVSASQGELYDVVLAVVVHLESVCETALDENNLKKVLN